MNELPRPEPSARWPRSIGASGEKPRSLRDVAPLVETVSALAPEYWGRRVGTLLKEPPSADAPGGKADAERKADTLPLTIPACQRRRQTPLA